MGGPWKEWHRDENWETTRVTSWCLLAKSQRGGLVDQVLHVMESSL